MSEPERYERAWRNYKWRLVAFLLAWLGLPIAAPALDDRIGFVWFGVLWIGSCLGTGFRLSMWRCPRCGHCFFWNFIHNQFARRCMHCGLPKWATSNDAGSTAEGCGATPATLRTEVTTTGDEARVAVRPNRNDGIVSFLRTWVVAWAVGEIIVPTLFLTSPMGSFEASFLLVWLVGWTLAGLAAIRALAWMTRGATTLAAGVTPGTVTRRPSWILPLAAINAVIAGLMLRWFGAEYAERVASACSVCRPGETPPVCQIPEFVTIAGTAMVLLGCTGVVILALRRVIRGGSTRLA